MITRLNAADEAQRAIIAALKADSDLIALVPAARIYPQQAPVGPIRPFVLFGSPIITPRYVDGGDCSDVSAAVHCFADATNAHKDARSFTNNVASHIARVINAMDDIDLGDGVALAIYVQQIQIINDGTPSSWHSFVTFRAEAS